MSSPRKPLPKWILLVALAAAPSCEGCGCKCFDTDIDCGADFGADGFGGGEWGVGGGTTTTVCFGCDCCENGDVCWQDICMSPGGPCHGPADCYEDQVCDWSLEGLALEATIAGGITCGAPWGLCVPAPPIVDCALSPATTPLSLAPAAAWGDPSAPSAEHSVVGAPAILQLDDDNCDGHADAHDIAEIIFATAAQDPLSPMNGTLHARTLRGGVLEPLWSTLPVLPANDPTSAIAAARTGAEALIVICTDDERIRAYDGDGVERWTGPPSARCDSLALLDVDFDFSVDVVSESQVLDGMDGAVIAEYGPAPSHGFAVIDLLPDPQLVLEIVTANRIYDHFGTVLVDTGGADGFVAVADGVVYSVDPAAHQLTTWRYENSMVDVIAQIDLHATFSASCPPGTAGELASGGPPAVTLSSDGLVHLAGVTTALGHVVYDEAGSLVWAAPGLDCEAPTRASGFFDFDGDGAAEVVRYRDHNVEIHDGADGSVLFSRCNTVEPAPAHPLVADVDADGFGELIAFASSRSPATCGSAAQAGVQVLRSNAPAMRTRSVYNEFAYRVYNTTEDGAATYDNANMAHGMRASASSSTAPNLRIEHVDCAIGARVRVHNDGAAAVAAGRASVLFLDPVSHDDLAQAFLPVNLAPGARIDVYMPDPPPSLEVTIASTDGRPLGECKTDDNLVLVSCE